MADSGETWKEVPGTEGTIIASSLGRVARVMGHETAGYMVVVLPKRFKVYRGRSMGTKSFRREQQRVYVHHVVAVTFIGEPPEGKPFINHIDGNRKNNRPDNLEWCTARHNLRHARRIGLIKKPHGKNLSSSELNLLFKLRRQGKTGREIAESLGRHLSTVLYRVRMERRNRGR